MAIKMFCVFTQVPTFSKICSLNKKAAAAMAFIVMKVDIFTHFFIHNRK